MESKQPEKETLNKTRKIRPTKGLSLKRRLFRKCQRVCGNKTKRGKRAFKSMLSSPNPSFLIFLSMAAFCFMCYLLGLDPSLIPFTLLFMVLITLCLLEDKQRNLVLQSVVPKWVLNVCSCIWDTFSRKKQTVNIKNEVRNITDDHSNSNDDIEDMHLKHMYLDTMTTDTIKSK